VSDEEKAEALSQLPRKFFDEMRSPDGTVRHAYAALAELLDGLFGRAPIDLMIYRRNSLKPGFQIRLEDDDPYLQAIRDRWGGALHKAFHDVIHDPGWKF